LQINTIGVILATINGLASQKDRNNFTVVRHLTPDELKRIGDSLRLVKEYKINNQLFEILTQNYSELFNDLKQFLETYKKGLLTQSNLDFVHLNLNRHILNFLTSFRTYLDHVETNLKRNCGPESSEFQAFKQACANQFDSNFSYRFVYKLRNYVQHCGLPLGSFKASLIDDVENIEDENFTFRINKPEQQEALSICFKKSDLIEKFGGWGGLVLPDLEKQPDEIEITEHINSVIKSVQKINEVVRSYDRMRANEAAHYLRTLQLEIINQYPSQAPIIVNYEINENDKSPVIKSLRIQFFPTELIDNILLTKNDFMRSEDKPR